MALVVTGMGGLAMIAGLLLLGQVAGSNELSDILLAGEAVADTVPSYRGLGLAW